MGWTDAIDAWIAWLRSAGRRSTTIQLRRYQLERVAAAGLRRSPWRVTETDLVNWLSQHEWSAETRKSNRSAIRAFYAWAQRSGHVRRSPAEQLPGVRVAPAVPRPTPDKILADALAGATDKDRLIIMLGANEGLRRGEIATLRFIDITEDAIRVVGGKGGKTRMVPLHPLVRQLLLDELDLRLRGERSTGWRYGELTDNWVFPARSGAGHVTPSAIGRAASRALGPGWPGHTLRHRFGTRIYDITGDILKVSLLLGHSRPETSARYAQVPGDALRDAVNAI